MKLEKIAIGGVKGRSLSRRVGIVYSEFTERLGQFACQTYDALDPEDESFPEDYARFQIKMAELDTRLAAILGFAFDDCSSLESIFKVSIPKYHKVIWNTDPSNPKAQYKNTIDIRSLSWLLKLTIDLNIYL